MSEHIDRTSNRILAYAVPAIGIAALLVSLPFDLASGAFLGWTA